MKPAPFEYVAPDTLEAALSALQEHGSDAKLLAGGQSLIPAMNFRVMQPAALIDLNKISALQFIRQGEDGSLRIGSMTRQSAVEHSIAVKDRAPLLYETMPFIAHPQIRNRGTIGGSLIHLDPAAELPVIALSLDARVKLQRTGGERWAEAADFFQYMFTCDVAHDEILTEVAFPAMPDNVGWSFQEFARRRGDYAMAGVAALLSLDANGACDFVRLVYLNLGEIPLKAVKASEFLAGELPTETNFLEAGEIASHECEPLGSIHATPEYQRHLAKILTQRALSKALSRIQGGQNAR